ncbi:MAG: UDP-2,3-diacylglucosamine diphosphatase LpxI [Magnetococcales bacterium]|nr:UDP-2,3-diacylglucosamine diphosphatase LpxI [Magnetococcales bacterium]
MIAGSGRLPLLFARTLLGKSKETGAATGCYPLYVAAHEGEADPSICDLAKEVQWVRLGQFKKIIRYMIRNKIVWIAMAGGITKTRIWKIRPDALALSLVVRLGTLHDDRLLRAVAGELEQQGFQVGSVTDFMPELLVPSGCLTERCPDSSHWQEIQFGWQSARELGRLDIGQGVVVKRKMVVSVEAMEGTDAMIQRSGPLLSGSGRGWANRGAAVLVKTSKPQQDRRLDLPTIGPDTIEHLHRAGIEVLAVEAESTMILEPEKTIRLANAHQIIIVGCSEQLLSQETAAGGV